ncbi:MAG: histidine phosphatase family protein [Chloroflexi bacterium]|nr:histidine phosphatase family protein [Chloroflexota bacterium]
MVELLLVRHGEAAGGTLQRIFSRGHDNPLTPRGREQAERLARRLEREEGLVALYTSPLQRAHQTAEIVAQHLHLEPVVKDGLREALPEEVIGLNMRLALAWLPFFPRSWLNHQDLSATWPGGQRQRAFFQRVIAVVEEIAAAHPNGRCIVVAHGGAIRACVAHFVPREMGQSWFYPVGNCSLSILSLNGAARLLAFNDHSHL